MCYIVSKNANAIASAIEMVQDLRLSFAKSCLLMHSIPTDRIPRVDRQLTSHCEMAWGDSYLETILPKQRTVPWNDVNADAVQTWL